MKLFQLLEDDSNRSKNSKEIKEVVVDKGLLYLSMLLPIALVVSLLRYFETGWNNIFILHIIIVSSLIIFAVKRKSIRYETKRLMLTGSFLLISIFGMSVFGLLGGAFFVLALFTIYVTILYEMKKGIYACLTSVIVLFVFAYLYNSNYIEYSFDIEAYTRSFLAWTMVIISFVLFVPAVIISISTIQNYLQSSLEQVHESFTEHKRLLDNLNSAVIYRHDNEGTISYVSSSVKKVLGYTEEEFKKDFHTFLTDNPINEKVDYYTQLALQGKPQKIYETEVYHKDGSKLMFDVSEVPVYDKDNKKIIGIEGILHDSTARAIAEKEVKEKAATIRVLLNAPFDRILLFDREGIILECNQRLLDDFNISYEEIIGKNVWSFFEDELKESRRSKVNEVIESGEPRRFEDVRNEIWFDNVLYPIFDELKSVSKIAVIARDITERKKMVGELKKSNELIKLAEDVAQIGSFEWDLKTNDVFYSENALKLYGITAEEYDGQFASIFDLIHKDDKKQLQLNIERNIERKTVSKQHYRVNRPDGKLRYFESLGEYIYDKHHEIVKMVGYVQDISERKLDELKIKELNEDLENKVKQRTKDLEELNKELNDFAYIVSHDLKAPLRGISQISNWLIEDYSEQLDADGKNYLFLLNERSQKMQNLIDGILAYSKAGRKLGSNQEINLNETVCEIIEFLNLPDKYEINFENNFPVLFADKAKIQQVFQNLITNAVKYNDKEKAFIDIRCKENFDHFIFEIEDNGIGIEEKYQDKVFQVFQRLNNEDTDSTGVGLSTVKKIVEFYNGKVWLESTPGKGAIFYFSLPKKMNNYI